MGFFSGLVKWWGLYYPKVIKRSEATSSRGTRNSLTPWEVQFIQETKFTCPDCERGKLMQGPEGGCAVNVECDHCLAKFNWFYGGGGHRLADGILEPTAKAHFRQVTGLKTE